MPTPTGPDFICIGMQKSGTGWLFDQLQHHPDFWMPPLKEIHYLDRDVPKLSNARKMLARAAKAPGKKLRNRRAWDERDRQFLDEAMSLSGKPMDLDAYAALFRYKRGLLTGDVTPGYSGMTEETIAQVAAKLPDVRIVQLVRDPVARIWSQISMASRREKFDPRLTEDPARFREFLAIMSDIDNVRGPKIDVQKVSFPARIAARWERNAPNLRFRHFFFDDIVTRPEEARSDLLLYLGGDPAKSSGTLAADHNRKAKNEKLPLSDDIKAVLVDFLRDEIRACAERFGGHARAWASAYGV